MIIPVRCISCGKPLAGLWKKFKKEIEDGKEPKEALNQLGIDSYCCRSLFLTHKDLIKEVGQFRV